MIKDFTDWKKDLLELLNVGWFNAAHWQAFITEARANGFDAMADDMQKRFEYYNTKGA